MIIILKHEKEEKEKKKKHDTFFLFDFNLIGKSERKNAPDSTC